MSLEVTTHDLRHALKHVDLWDPRHEALFMVTLWKDRGGTIIQCLQDLRIPTRVLRRWAEVGKGDVLARQGAKRAVRLRHETRRWVNLLWETT